MTGPWRTAANSERRRDLLLAAAGFHPASAAVRAARGAPALKAPRLLRAQGEEPAS
ncbi:hypothetical protein SAMN05216223_116138 [Actinacidiphila yanglinensis]|uniref:Uncharacterized protein n=1 Tax=Actinacidiphila yanglinensis TaxID=310779 RepID=A0A1H6DKM9_9ACTN|nr:hypothetical protein SAMN05216223_116138 [Actinacidiphila yanglinensis]